MSVVFSGRVMFINDSRSLMYKGEYFNNCDGITLFNFFYVKFEV